MTGNPAQDLAVATSSDEQPIVQYLQQHPDFFERHLPLLTRMRLQHPRNSSTVSLIERQVEVLREKHVTMEQQLAEFVRVARANDQLADRIHRFTMRLLRTTTRAAALNEIQSSLRQDFDTFLGVLLLQHGNAGDADTQFVRIVASDDANFRSFDSLLTSGKPRCGQVRDSQREYLFGNHAAEVGSVALIPLVALSPPGLLVLGSADRDRFHPGMSTEFLARMGELIAAALSRS